MAEDAGVETFGSRLLHGVRRLFSSRARASTPREYELASRIDDLRERLSRSESLSGSRETEIGELKSSLRIANLEVEKLAEVVERDRVRIQAETAELTKRINDATSQER